MNTQFCDNDKTEQIMAVNTNVGGNGKTQQIVVIMQAQWIMVMLWTQIFGDNDKIRYQGDGVNANL